MDARKIIEENLRRKEEISRRFDPLSGEGSVGERFRCQNPSDPAKSVWLPISMKGIRLSAENYEEMRCLHDFPYWRRDTY